MIINKPRHNICCIVNWLATGKGECYENVMQMKSSVMR